MDERVGEWDAAAREADAGRLAGRAVDRAIELALRGDVDGIVTAPLDKHALLAGGYDFPGHTELLAARTGRAVAMMLAATRPTARNAATRCASCSPRPTSRCATCRDSSRATSILDAARVTRDGLRDWFGIAAPRIALCALNPHAGDDGRFGREDDDLLAPAAREAGSPARFRRTRCSCARCAARSTPSSRRITTSA